MEAPGDLSSKSFTLNVTSVDGSDTFLRIIGYTDKTASGLLGRLMAEVDSDLKAGKGMLASGVLPPPGLIIAAQYKDSNFYRARVLEARELLVSVVFIDYGNKEVIPASAVRTLEWTPQLLAMPPVAKEYVLGSVWSPAGRWDDNLVKHIQSTLNFREHQLVVEMQTATHTIISLQVNNTDLANHLVSHKFGSYVTPQRQAELLSQYHPNSMVEQPRNVLATSQDIGYPEHAVPFSPNRVFPTNPASAMRSQNTSAGSLNGGYVNPVPLPQIVPPSSVSQRLQVHRSAPRNVINLKPMRQPLANTSNQSGDSNTSPPRESPGSDPSSPKKSLAYKVRFLQPNSEHKVYVSIAREGPELFAVQLTSEARRLQEMMNELNRLPHRNLPSPPAPGTVCLGRQSSDRTVCRALSMGVCGSNAKLYFVDFGDTELVSFYDVFVIPEKFVLPPTYSFQFRLSRSHAIPTGPELNEVFQNLVEHKQATLRVVQAEEAPLIQFAELYVNGANVTDLMLQQTGQSSELKYLEVLPVGTTQSVLVSYVDSCLKFFVQLSDNIDALNEVMEAVDVHCKSAAPLTFVISGAQCCALFPDDGAWYRARVVEARGARALVCYVDYGNEQEVQLSQLRGATPALLQLPVQALKCALKGYEDKPVDTQTSNQLEMMALEKTLRARVWSYLDDGAMLVSLVHDAISPPMDIAEHMMHLSRPGHLRKASQAKTRSPEEPAGSSPESVEPDKNRFRSDRHFREDRRPREGDDWQRGGSFRARQDREKSGFDRSGLGRHSEKCPRGRKIERQGGKPGQDEGNPSDDWGDSRRPGGGRSGPSRRKPKGEQPEDKMSKPAWKQKGDNTKRFRQGSDNSDASSHQSDSSQRTQQSSVQQRLRRDNFKKPDDTWEDGQDTRPKRENWGDRRESKPAWGDKRENRREWDMKDDRFDNESRSKDSWGEKKERGDKDNWGEKKDRGDKGTWGEKRDGGEKDSWGEKKDRGEKNSWGERRDRGDKEDSWGEKKDRGEKNSWGEKRDRGDGDSWGQKRDRGDKEGWGDKKENSRGNYQDRGERRERSNFNPRERAERSFDGNRSFGSNKSFSGAPTKKELPSPVPLDTQFTSPLIEAGSQQEVSVAWFISPESFYAQLTSEQAAFTDMMNSIPELYKGVRPYSGNVDVGSSILARFPVDRVLYRATVLGVQPFGKYIVQYIDFGNKYVVESKDIWQLDQKLMAVPRMAVHCALVSVKAPEGEWKTSKEIDLCFNAPRYQCIFQECGDETYRVSLWNNGQSVAELLAEKNLAVLAEESSVTLKDEPIDLAIVVGQQMMCRVTHVESFATFHIQLDLEKAELVENTIVNCDPSLLKPLPAESMADGTHCTLSHEGRVYRAVLQDTSDESAIVALLPDFGYTVTTSAANLTILPSELSVYYYQSLVCSFHNYSEGATKLLTEEELVARLKGNKFIIYINYVDGTTLVSTLYETTGAKVAAFEPDEGAYESVVPLCERAVHNYNFGAAYASHAASLALVYLQRASDADRIARLLDALFKFYEEGTPEDLVSYDSESLCAAKSSDGNWYRATIITAEEEECNVHFVDYGNDEVISKKLIKKLDPKFFEPYSLALVVSLGLTPLQDDAVTKLLELIADQEVLVTLTIGDEGWLANLHLDGEDLSLKLVGDKIAAPQETVSKETGLGATVTEEPVSLPTGTVQAYIAHVDTPGQFWLQMADKVDRIEAIQAELQEHAASYPELENKEMATLCVAKYSVDEMWYRAEILDCDADITTVRFIDYGNTDVLDNVPNVLKAMPDHLKEERHAVKSSVNAVPTGTGQWSESASDYFTELVGDMSVPLEAIIVLKDVTTYVDLFVNGQNLTDKLVLAGHATKSEDTECGDLASCFASHVNTPSEFWIQLENSAPELQEVEAAMADSENFPELTDKEEGTLCAAKYPEDGCWYRAQIIVEGSEGTEVLFMDYGNASIASELRSLPDELKSKPALSRKCALQKPQDIKSWSRKSELKFNEMAAEGATIFNVQFIASGDISIVELYLDGKSVTEELAAMCEAPPASERPAPLGQDILSIGTVCHSNTVYDFYVQLEECNAKLDKIINTLTQAKTFDDASDVKIGSLVAAFWTEDEQWYRAKIIEFCDIGSHVQFLDYGNKAKCETFKQMPTELAEVEPLAKHCTLVRDQADVAPDDKMNERFYALVSDPDALVQIEFLDTTKETTVVRLLLKGEDVHNLIKVGNTELVQEKTESEVISYKSDEQPTSNLNDATDQNSVEEENAAQEKIGKIDTQCTTVQEEKIDLSNDSLELNKDEKLDREKSSHNESRESTEVEEKKENLEKSNNNNSLDSNADEKLGDLETSQHNDSLDRIDSNAATDENKDLDTSRVSNLDTSEIEERTKDLNKIRLNDSLDSCEDDKGDMDSSKLDDSADGNLTVIESQSLQNKSGISEQHSIEVCDKKTKCNESFQNEDEAFSTPPDSPKKSISSGSPDSINYEECHQTPAKSLKEKLTEDSDSSEIKSDVPAVEPEPEVTKETMDIQEKIVKPEINLSETN